MKHSTYPLLMGCITALVCSACGSDAPQAPKERPTFKFPLQVSTKSITDEPIAGVPVLLVLDNNEEETKTIGYTDKDGKFEALIDANHKTPVAVMLTTPAGYTRADGRDFVEDELVVKPDEKDGTLVHANTITLDAVYQSKEIDHLVWVKLECKSNPEHCEDIPIKIGDEIVATTDIEGRAHFVLTEVPDKTVRVTLDTTVAISDEDVIQLEPANPGFNLTLPGSSQVFTIEETLSEPEVEEEKPKPVAKKKRRRKSTRKKSSRKKKSSSSKKKSSGSSLSFGSKKTSTKKPAKKKPKKTGNGISLF